MNKINSTNYSIFFENNGFNELNNFLKLKNYSNIFLHVDNNTYKSCYKHFLKKIDFSIDYVIKSRSGEENKNISSCERLWESLSENNADRKSVLINLGGGVAGDMGGFVASTFKRGIDFINVPTTLLSMVDASIGGKTGVDLGVLKNLVGTFNNPKMVIIDPLFLNTLDYDEILSGYAEIFKHALISKNDLFEDLNKNSTDFKSTKQIRRSIEIKNNIVLSDPYESKMRKILNFGHTIGHAIESYSMTKKHRLLHGNAIAIGMITESFISNKLYNFPIEKVKKIKNHLINLFGLEKFTRNEIDSIIKLIKHDKKNTHGKVNFVLLKNLGDPIFDVSVKDELIFKSFEFYLN